jgi:hypothetical protein
MCERIPDAWTVGRQNRPVFWLRSKKRSFNMELSGSRGWAISFYNQRVSLTDIIPDLNYVWCNKCSKTQYDKVLIEKVIEVSLRLENTKYEEFP